MISVWLLVFLLGLAIGSFLNALVYRLLHGDSVARGRSYCPKCRKQIAWYDNIPLVSFALLGGKCRRCHKQISWRYPVLEFLTGILFVWWFEMGKLFFRLTAQPFGYIQPAFWLGVGVVLVALTVADLFYGVLPDMLTKGLMVWALAYRVLLTRAGIMQAADFGLAMAAAAGAGLFFAGLILITRGRGMGWGDVKLAIGMGLVVGWPRILVAVMSAFLTGAAAGGILILVGKKTLKQTVPFGPFLVLGTVIALVWGENLWGMYLRMLGW